MESAVIDGNRTYVVMWRTTPGGELERIPMRVLEFEDDHLIELTDDGSWQRGTTYFREGRVGTLLTHENSVAATVQGTEPYRVTLTADDDGLHGECTCPMGDEDVFCKHCVAVAIACRVAFAEKSASGDEPTAPRESRRGKRRKKAASRAKHQVDCISVETIRDHLEQMESNSLAEIILKQALRDEGFLNELMLIVARYRLRGSSDRSSAKSPRGGARRALSAFRKAITAATRTRGFIEYRGSGTFANGIHRVLDQVAEIIDEDNAQDVMKLAEYAHDRCERALGQMDDSAGHMSDVFGDIEQIHHAACAMAKPDPKELAKHLFDLEMKSEWDGFHHASKRYAELLGAEGLDAYRQQAANLWDELPELAPGDEGSFEGHRFRLSRIMEDLAEMSGDVDQMVKVRMKDLSSPYRFLQIAELYAEHGQIEKAIDWAQRGIREFPSHRDDRLKQCLINLYQAGGRIEDAVTLAWEMYIDGPGLNAYQVLKQCTERAAENPEGKYDWKIWREKALDHMHLAIRQAKQERKGVDNVYTNHSRLVEILLWENEIDQAWKEAGAGGCTTHLWLQLAQAREATHPLDAASVYQELIGPTVEQTNNRAYHEAIKLLMRIEKLMTANGRAEHFDSFMGAIRRRYKRKRNFMRMLDDQGNTGRRSKSAKPREKR